MNSVGTNPNYRNLSQEGSNEIVMEKGEPEVPEIPEIKDLAAKKKELNNLLHQNTVRSEEGFIDKLLKLITYGNLGVNAFSVGLSSLALKNNGLENNAKKTEKVGLLVNKLQAITLGTSFIKEAFKTKNIVLLLTGLAQAFKLPTGYNRLFRLAGIPSALDQLPAAINPITGKTKYKSFQESWQLNTKIIKDVWQEFTSAPVKFLKYLNPKSKEATKALIPASIFMIAGTFLSNIFDFPIFGALRKPLVALGSLPRHIGGLSGDLGLFMDKINSYNRKAGLIYSIGTTVDYVGLLANKKMSHIMHQLSYLFLPLAEMFVIKGSSEDPIQANAKNRTAPVNCS